MKTALGVDLGTSSLKAVLVGEDGRILATVRHSYATAAPQDGWAEQQPEDWWRALCAAVPDLLAASGLAASSIQGMALCGQMHGIVAVDGTGLPVHPAIIWADRRGSAEIAYLNRLFGDRLLAITGSVPATSFTAVKMLWLRAHRPDVLPQARWLMTAKDALALRLSGTAATDPCDASGTLLFDVRLRDWSDEVLDALALPRAILPPIYPSGVQVGVVSGGAARQTGLRPGTPIFAGAGDTEAMALGCGVLTPAEALVTISSGGVVLVPQTSPAIDPGGRVHTLCHVASGTWHSMGAILAAGLAWGWGRRLLPGDADPARSPLGARGLFFLPYLLGERSPHMDEHASACLLGLREHHGPDDVARAIMEGVAFALRDCWDLCVGLAGGEPAGGVSSVRLAAAGARNPTWRSIIADVLGRPLEPMAEIERGALGAALLAGVGAGLFPSLDAALAQALRPGAIIEPSAAAHAAYQERYAHFRALYPALRGWFAAVDPAQP